MVGAMKKLALISVLALAGCAGPATVDEAASGCLSDPRVMNEFYARPVADRALVVGLKPDGSYSCIWGSHGQHYFDGSAYQLCNNHLRLPRCALLARGNDQVYRPQVATSGSSFNPAGFLLGSALVGAAQGYSEAQSMRPTIIYAEPPAAQARAAGGYNPPTGASPTTRPTTTTPQVDMTGMDTPRPVRPVLATPSLAQPLPSSTPRMIGCTNDPVKLTLSCK